MFGCLRRLGCLAILLVVAAFLYLNRERWLPYLRTAGAPATRVSTDGVWKPLTPEGADRGRQAVASLGTRSGPVYATVEPADLASYVFTALRQQLPPSATNVEAATFGDQLHVRALVSLSDFGGARVLGPLASFLSARDTVQFGGTFEVVRPGLAQYHVRTIKLRQLAVPAAMVPKLLAQVRRGGRPDGIADDALPLEVPSSIADVRVARGRVTLYKVTR